jgi:hypothetical protein
LTIVLSATAVEAVQAAGLALLLPIGGLLAVAVQWRDVRRTTLLAGWCWMLAALLSLAASEAVFIAVGNPPPAWAEHLRYAAAVTTFCPLMALLGSKRPQHGAWQWIVLTFLGVLLLPAVEALLFYPTEPLSLHPARRWFLAILIAVGAFNSLPTRYWPTGLLTCVGQVLVLSDYLPLARLGFGDWAVTTGVGCLAAGQIMRAARLPRGRRAASHLDRLWLDFRDNYGTLWALRVADRFNDSARRLGWGATLGWRGFEFERADDQFSAQACAVVSKGLRALLRRFVSPEWIARRR